MKTLTKACLNLHVWDSPNYSAAFEPDSKRSNSKPEHVIIILWLHFTGPYMNEFYTGKLRQHWDKLIWLLLIFTKLIVNSVNVSLCFRYELYRTKGQPLYTLKGPAGVNQGSTSGINEAVQICNNWGSDPYTAWRVRKKHIL